MRNKLLHRFYEPLVLLYVLDRTQGDHVVRPTSELLPLGEITAQELRRRFLDSLSYVCDYEKGGDTMTAIGIASVPMTFYIAGNKTPADKVVLFLCSLLARLGSFYHRDTRQRSKEEAIILQECTDFSEKRLKTYWKLLQESMTKCGDRTKDDVEINSISKLQQQLATHSSTMLDLCLYCDSLMKSAEMNYVKARAAASQDYGNEQSPFAQVRHFIGRLAYHPRSVRVLVSAATRLPALFLDPIVTVVESPPSLVLPPAPRSKTNLDGILNRMIAGDEPRLVELQTRLKHLDRAHEIERIVREEYSNKNFRPRVHAELILLEHFYRNRDRFDFVGNDAFIGSSKPSCYCCFLYFRAHPGNFVEPATHQKIYLNWMAPTSVPGVQNPASDLAVHERYMLNRMVDSIRRKTVDQIMSRSGRRKKHFDSVTGDTFSARTILEPRKENEVYPSGSLMDMRDNSEEDGMDNSVADLASYLENALDIAKSTDDMDTGGTSLV